MDIFVPNWCEIKFLNIKQVLRLQGLFNIFRKDLENICNIFKFKLEYLLYKSKMANILRIK